MSNSTIKMPAAVDINIQGIPAAFVDVPPGDKPVEMSFTRLGELAPYQRGMLASGVAILVLPANVADVIRMQYANEIAKQKAAAAAQGH